MTAIITCCTTTSQPGRGAHFHVEAASASAGDEDSDVSIMYHVVTECFVVIGKQGGG
jgi:hypothetical protein